MISKTDSYAAKQQTAKYKTARLKHLINRVIELKLCDKQEIAASMGITSATLERYLEHPSNSQLTRILSVLDQFGVNRACTSLTRTGCPTAKTVETDLDRIDYELHTENEKAILRDFGSVIFKHRVTTDI